MTRVGDTSVVYALFDKDDAHHLFAKDAFEDPAPIVLPTEVLVETIDLIAYRATWQMASSALGWLLGQPNVRIAEQVHVPAVREIHANAEGALSLTDAFVVQTCRALGAEPLAKDEEITAAVG